jgi:hypothetical protein
MDVYSTKSSKKMIDSIVRKEVTIKDRREMTEDTFSARPKTNQLNLSDV